MLKFLKEPIIIQIGNLILVDSSDSNDVSKAIWDEIRRQQY